MTSNSAAVDIVHVNLRAILEPLFAAGQAFQVQLAFGLIADWDEDANAPVTGALDPAAGHAAARALGRGVRRLSEAEPIVVRLPRVLAQVTGGLRRFRVSGRTLREALDDLLEQQPGLAYHLFDEAGRMRRHILCFCNDECRRGRDGLEVPVRGGDTITILNSVAGG